MSVNTGSFYENTNEDPNNADLKARTEARKQAFMDALVRERDAYVARGEDVRAEAVNTTLRDLGYREENTKTAKPENARNLPTSGVEKRDGGK